MYFTAKLRICVPYSTTPCGDGLGKTHAPATHPVIGGGLSGRSGAYLDKSRAQLRVAKSMCLPRNLSKAEDLTLDVALTLTGQRAGYALRTQDVYILRCSAIYGVCVFVFLYCNRSRYATARLRPCVPYSTTRYFMRRRPLQNSCIYHLNCQRQWAQYQNWRLT